MKRMITPIARGQFDWIANTYSVGNVMDDWCNQIAKDAHPRHLRQSEIDLSHILDEMKERLEQPLPESDLDLSLTRFTEGTLAAKIAILRTVLAERALPNQVRANVTTVRAFSDSSLPVEICSVYEVDFSKQIVTFNAFASTTPEAVRVGDPAERASDW